LHYESGTNGRSLIRKWLLDEPHNALQPASTLDRCDDPFDHAWLSNNEVTSREQREMLTVMAGMMHWFVNQDPETQARIVSERR
jgi:hypothetical protein